MVYRSLNIEIAYVQDQQPVLLQGWVTVGTTLLEALKVFSLDIPSLALSVSDSGLESLSVRVGIFGRQKPLDTVLRAGDRIEIYEPLLLDPKETRRLKALASAKRFKKERKS